MENPQRDFPSPAPGLLAGLAGVARNGLALLLNRIELAGLELAEVRSNLLQLSLVLALGMIAAWFAIAYWTVLLVFLSWDALGGAILLILALVFTAVAIGLFLYARSVVSQGKLSLPATMAELQHDRDALL